MFVALRDPSFKNYQKEKDRPCVTNNNLAEQQQQQPIPVERNEILGEQQERKHRAMKLTHHHNTAPVIVSVAQDDNQVTYITGKNFSETGCFVMHQEKVLETKFISKELLSCAGVAAEEKDKVRVVNPDSQSFVMEHSFLSFAPLSNRFRPQSPSQNVKVILYGVEIGFDSKQEDDTMTLQVQSVDTLNIHSKVVVQCHATSKFVTFVDAFQPSMLPVGKYRLLAHSNRFPNMVSSAVIEIRK